MIEKFKWRVRISILEGSGSLGWVSIKKAIITGVTGQDGAYLAKFLLDKGYRVYGTYRRLSTPNFWRIQSLGIHEDICLLSCELGDQSSMINIIQEYKPDEFYNPDLYLNLARIYLTFDMKSDAIRFLRRGLMVEPDNDQIQTRLVELGVRRRPLFRFLPRSHVFNRIFGRVQSRVLGPSFRGLTKAA